MAESSGVDGRQATARRREKPGVHQSTGWLDEVGSRRWSGHLSGEAAAVRLVLGGVVMLAEQAAELSDEQLRSRLVALGGLVR